MRCTLCTQRDRPIFVIFRRSHNLKLPDAIIAATAKVYGLRLLKLDRQLHPKFIADLT